MSDPAAAVGDANVVKPYGGGGLNSQRVGFGSAFVASHVLALSVR
jgi:hypothetical protein